MSPRALAFMPRGETPIFFCCHVCAARDALAAIICLIEAAAERAAAAALRFAYAMPITLLLLPLLLLRDAAAIYFRYATLMRR